MEEIVLCKIQDVKKSYYLFTTVKDDGKEGFHLILCDGKDSWEGDISGDDVHDLCSSTNMDYKNYVEMTVQALTGKSHPGMFSFQYQVDHTSGDSVQFHWKKHIVNDDVKFRLGSTKLIGSDDSNKTIQRIFDHCIGKISNLNHKITSTHTENKKLSQERANALKRLDNCVSAKEKLEEDLYSKFLMVLNSKKKEIGKLRQKVEDQHQNSEGTAILGSDENNSSSYSVETEDDEPDSPKPVGGKKAKLNDDSLVFTDDSPDEDMDDVPRDRKPAIKKVVSSKASTSNISSEFDISKIKKMKKEISSSSNLLNKSSSANTSDLLDDF